MPKSADIIVVDDDPDIRDVLRMILEGAGHKVRVARESQEALQLLEERVPNLMILDIMMNTDTEGFDLMHQIKDTPETSELPVILLTSFLGKVSADGVGDFDYIMGEQWSASWIFEKPVNKEKLLKQIDAILDEK
jgi:two-component system, NtrC family, nitrogen regulation response regulator NtrX